MSKQDKINKLKEYIKNLVVQELKKDDELDEVSTTATAAFSQGAKVKEEAKEKVEPTRAQPPRRDPAAKFTIWEIPEVPKDRSRLLSTWQRQKDRNSSTATLENKENFFISV